MFRFEFFNRFDRKRVPIEYRETRCGSTMIITYDYELAQRLVIILDGLVCWFEVKLFHQQEEPGSDEILTVFAGMARGNLMTCMSPAFAGLLAG